MAGIEIYVRHNAGGAMLSIHLDSTTKQRLLDALQEGSFNAPDTSMHLELTLLPEWLDPLGSLHSRIPLVSINVSTVE